MVVDRPSNDPAAAVSAGSDLESALVLFQEEADLSAQEISTEGDSQVSAKQTAAAKEDSCEVEEVMAQVRITLHD